MSPSFFAIQNRQKQERSWLVMLWIFIQFKPRSSIHSFIHSFIYSFIHSCIHAFMHSCASLDSNLFFDGDVFCVVGGGVVVLVALVIFVMRQVFNEILFQFCFIRGPITTLHQKHCQWMPMIPNTHPLLDWNSPKCIQLWPSNGAEVWRDGMLCL